MSDDEFNHRFQDRCNRETTNEDVMLNLERELLRNYETIQNCRKRGKEYEDKTKRDLEALAEVNVQRNKLNDELLSLRMDIENGKTEIKNITATLDALENSSRKEGEDSVRDSRAGIVKRVRFDIPEGLPEETPRRIRRRPCYMPPRRSRQTAEKHPNTSPVIDVDAYDVYDVDNEE